MNDETNVGTLGIDVVANVAEFEQRTTQQLKESGARIGREAGQSMGNAMGGADTAALAAQRGREQVRAQVQAMQDQYRTDMARIKEGQLRGFLTEAEAKRAGREAAQAFNDGMTPVLDEGARSGAFRGREGGQLFTEVAGSIKQVGTESRRAVPGLGQIRESLASVAAQFAGTNPIVGRFVNVLGGLAVSGTVMIGVLAGLALLGAAWTKVTASIREAKEEAEANIGTLERLLQKARDGATGEINRGIVEAEARLKEVDRKIKEHEAKGHQRDTSPALVALDREYEEIDALITAGEAEVKRIIQEAKDEQLKEHESANDKRVAADKAMYGEARTLLEQWTTSQMTELEKRIAQLERFEAAATKLGNSGAAAEIRRQREELEKQLKVYEDLADLRPTGVSPIGGRGGARPVLANVGAQTAGIEAALQRQIDLLQIAQARGEITQKQMEEGITAAAANAADQIIELLELYESLGLVSAEVIAAIAAALRRTKAETDSNTASVSDYASAFEAVARGVIGASDAMGVLSDSTRRLLTGLIDVASALQEIQKASELDGFAKTIGMIGGVGAMIGGVLQIGSALFGESPAEKERRDVLKRNTEALEDLALELNGFRVTTDVLQRFLGAQTVSTRGLYSMDRSVEGFSEAELRAIERELGITLFDSKGRLIPRAVEQAKEAIRLQQANGGITAGAGIPPQDRLSVSMTVVQGNRLIDLMATSVDHLRALRVGLVGGTGVSIPVAQVAGAAPGSISIGEINVTVRGGDDPIAVGRAVGDGVVEAIDRRIPGAYRGAGIPGPIVNVVRTE